MSHEQSQDQENGLTRQDTQYDFVKQVSLDGLGPEGSFGAIGSLMDRTPSCKISL